MGDKGKGRDKGKEKSKVAKPSKHGLRPHEEREQQERLIKKTG